MADLGDRYPVPSYGLDVELLDRDRDGFLLGFGDDGPEALGAVADQINGPASRQSPPLLPGWAVTRWLLFPVRSQYFSQSGQ